MATTKTVFSSRLREARQKMKLNQTQLGDACGISQSRISGFENDNILPDLNEVTRLSQALHVNCSWLCAFDETSIETTPFQWLCYLDALLDNPPSIDEHPIIQLRQTENGTTEIVFTGAVMQDFFKKYIATRSIKETIGDDLYGAAIEKLFDGSTFYFTPGSRETHIIHHPPDLSNFSGYREG